MNIYQFGTVTLPDRQPVWDDSLPADTRTLATLGGHFNPFRGEQAPVKLPRPITVSAYQLAASASALGSAIDTLRGKSGQRDRLWLHPYDTTEVDRWCWATLKQIVDRGSYKDRIWQRFDLTFEAESNWNGHAYGGAWNLDAGFFFDNGLYFDSTGAFVVNAPVQLPNAGNRLVTNAGITYVCGNGTNKAVTISTTNTIFTLTGVSAGDTWIVDCGARSVRKNGAPAYQYFSLGATHASPWWFEIPAGGVTMQFWALDALDSVQVTYNDGWL